ncbi:flavodoxin family protein [candidate division KSB1 bacterium]
MSNTKNVVIINGATRIKGNTDTLIKKIIESSTDPNLNIKLYTLRDKKIDDCIGCYNCYEKNKCSIKDDMREIHEAIQTANLLIFASPLYWWGVTGLMKTFIDRLYLYYPLKNRHLISGKKAIIITTMAVKEVQEEAKILIEFYRLLFNRLDIKTVDTVFFSGIMKKGELLENEGFINKAHLMGKNLIHYLEKK